MRGLLQPACACAIARVWKMDPATRSLRQLSAEEVAALRAALAADEGTDY